MDVSGRPSRTTAVSRTAVHCRICPADCGILVDVDSLDSSSIVYYRVDR
jgi:hypothetical protein